MKFQHYVGTISPIENKDAAKSMRSWDSHTPQEHLECMVGLIASSSLLDTSKTEVEETNTGLQIKVSAGNMAMTINQCGKFEIYELIPQNPQ